MTTTAGPLSGLRVVEIAQYVAGPMAGLILADMGADVVKVETSQGGDAFRTYGIRHEGLSAFWLNVNRGKRSISLDFKQAGDVERCRELLTRADAVVISSRPGALDAVGLDDGSLAELNRDLVRVHVTGYGPTGPRSDEPVFDNLVQALSGLAVFQGGDSGADVLAPMVADKTTAFTIASSLLAAIVMRHRSGEGSRIDISLLDAIAYWNFPDLFQDRTFLADGRRVDRLPSPISPTSDGQIVVSPVSGRQIANTARALGHPEWVGELKAIPDPTALVHELFARVRSTTAAMTTADALGRLKACDVPAAPVLDLDAHLEESQVVHNQLYETVDDPTLGPVRTVRHPAVFDGERVRAPFQVPRPADDRDSVVRDWELDWDSEESS